MALIQLSRPISISLRRLAEELCREFAAAYRIDGQLVDRDIAARRHEAVGGRLWANQRERLQRQLEKVGITEDEWCKQELGCDIGTMRRRVQLAKGWDQYERNRRDEGSNGRFGLVYGLSLIRTQLADHATNAHRLRTHSVSDAPRLDVTRCQFITGDALDELHKQKSETVNTIITSPAYWPLKRTYGGGGIGYEATPAEYLRNIVAIMREARRVLKVNGTLWIVIGDSYSRPAKVWTPQADTRKRPDSQKHSMLINDRVQAGDRPIGNLLMIPSRLAIALQDDGWILRQAIVWDKVWGRPEAVKNRTTQTYEMVYMFAKQSGYFYDQDPLRVSSTSHRKPAKQQAGMVRPDGKRTDLRALNNPLGHNAPSVWQIRQAGYAGKHPATFPTELVRRIIVTACDTNSLVLDPFGGSGTTALVALQHGHRAVTIDSHKSFTDEARERLSNAPAHGETADAQAMELAAD